jgi:hypothetical protein
MRGETFELFIFPVEDIRTNGFEFIEPGDEYHDIEVVAQVDPGDHEEDEVRSYERMIYIV